MTTRNRDVGAGRWWTGTVAVVGTLGALTACASSPPVPEDVSDAEITLARSPCFGMCPVYTVTLFGDGRVVYDGESWAEVEGPQEAQVDPADVAGLVSEFFEIGYFDLDDEYTEDVTDMATTTTSITVGEYTKSISDYGRIAPRKLVDLEDRIDEVAGTAAWVGN